MTEFIFIVSYASSSEYELLLESLINEYQAKILTIAEYAALNTTRIVSCSLHSSSKPLQPESTVQPFQLHLQPSWLNETRHNCLPFLLQSLPTIVATTAPIVADDRSNLSRPPFSILPFFCLSTLSTLLFHHLHSTRHEPHKVHKLR